MRIEADDLLHLDIKHGIQIEGENIQFICWWLMEGYLNLNAMLVIKIVVRCRGGHSVEEDDGRITAVELKSLGVSVDDNVGADVGCGSFVYSSIKLLYIAFGEGLMFQMTGLV